jgi:hypothetical protein
MKPSGPTPLKQLLHFYTVSYREDSDTNSSYAYLLFYTIKACINHYYLDRDFEKFSKYYKPIFRLLSPKCMKLLHKGKQTFI